MALVKHAMLVAGEEYISGSGRSAGRLPLVSLILGGLSCLGMLISIWLIFFYTPIDTLQGQTQRILYFHVPISWIALLSFVVLTVAGVAYIFKSDERLDWLARASAEVGVLFLTLTLVIGSIWARPIWGAWWVWEPRLTTSLILWFMFIGYLMLRSYMGRTSASARVGAVWSIVGVVDVPVIYLSVVWWRGQHPTQQLGVSGALPPEAVLTMLVTIVTFTLLYCFLMVQVYQFQRLQALAQRLRAIIE